ncbi:hypothetical protein COO60DRAFT_1224520 [Scenedesmus sp. NREL 46B-D3]|nr:hypothetical protein COO60DRAFT_1224520 [Scenedesmus sp. NREL 46B-D3]
MLPRLLNPPSSCRAAAMLVARQAAPSSGARLSVASSHSAAPSWPVPFCTILRMRSEAAGRCEARLGHGACKMRRRDTRRGGCSVQLWGGPSYCAVFGARLSVASSHSARLACALLHNPARVGRVTKQTVKFLRGRASSCRHQPRRVIAALMGNKHRQAAGGGRQTAAACSDVARLRQPLPPACFAATSTNTNPVRQLQQGTKLPATPPVAPAGQQHAVSQHVVQRR